MTPTTTTMGEWTVPVEVLDFAAEQGVLAYLPGMLDVAGLEPTRTLVTDTMKVYERAVLKDVTWHP